MARSSAAASLLLTCKNCKGNRLLHAGSLPQLFGQLRQIGTRPTKSLANARNHSSTVARSEQFAFGNISSRWHVQLHPCSEW